MDRAPFILYPGSSPTTSSSMAGEPPGEALGPPNMSPLRLRIGVPPGETTPPVGEPNIEILLPVPASLWMGDVKTGLEAD